MKTSLNCEYCHRPLDEYKDKENCPFCGGLVREAGVVRLRRDGFKMSILNIIGKMGKIFRKRFSPLTLKVWGVVWRIVLGFYAIFMWFSLSDAVTGEWDFLTMVLPILGKIALCLLFFLLANMYNNWKPFPGKGYFMPILGFGLSVCMYMLLADYREYNTQLTNISHIILFAISAIWFMGVFAFRVYQSIKDTKPSKEAVHE